MSDVASIIADLVRAGVDPELIGRTAAALAQNVQIVQNVQDPVAEKRRAYDRERKSSKRNSGGIPPESADTNLSSKVSPQTPFPNSNPIPPSPPKGGSSPADFDEFWSIYPNRVGKRDAEKAFSKALKRTDLEAILSGLRRYVAKTDDRPWCNPATWLNQDRWEDQPARPPQQPQQRATAPPPRKRNFIDVAKDRFAGQGHGPENLHGSFGDDERFSTRLIGP